jgi:Domain of unknown function (DUF4167)
MRNGRKSPAARRHRSESPFDAQPKRWVSTAPGDQPKSFQNLKKDYERYLALARAEAQNGNSIAAENYYQHAEHYLRSMSSEPKET